MFEGEQVTASSIFAFDKQTPYLDNRFDELDLVDNRMSLGERAATQRAQSQFVMKRRQNSMASPGIVNTVDSRASLELAHQPQDT